MLPIFTSDSSFIIGKVDIGLSQVLCPYKSESELRILLAEEFEGPACEQFERLLPWKSGEVNNWLLFLPPKQIV